MLRRFLVLFLVAAAVLLLWLTPLAAFAQNEIRFSTLEIDLWPEYDRPTMLVIYRATLAPEISLPTQVAFRIPLAAGRPTAVAVGPALDLVADVDFDVEVNGEWTEVTIPATAPAIQFEFYDPGLRKEGNSRYFTYTWPGGYAVDSLAIQVQQPVDSSEMQISPALDGGSLGQDGLTYFNKQIGSLSAGEPFTLTISYQKTSDTLSVRRMPVQPGAPIAASGDMRNTMMAALPWILGALGVVLIVGGAWWYWLSGRTQEQPQARRRRKAASSREAVPAEGHIYCHNCGKRAAPGDRFCRTCGSKLRIE